MKKNLLLIAFITLFSIAECIVCYFINIPEYIALIICFIWVLIIVLRSVRGKRFSVLSYLILSVAVLGPAINAHINPYWSSEILSEYGITEMPKTQSFDTKLTKRQAKRDLRSLIYHLKKAHPLCARGIPQNIQKEYVKILESLNDSSTVSVNEIYRWSECLLSKLHDGHTKSSANYPYNHIANFPYASQIIAINGISIEDLYDQNSYLFSTETPEWGELCLQNTIKTYEGLLFLNININDGIKYDITINERDTCLFYKREDFEVKESKTSINPNNSIGNYIIVDTCNYAILTLNNCNYYSSSSIQRFNTGINALFSSIKEKGIDNIIIDIRYNTGGNLALVVELMRYFPLKKYLLYRAEFRRGPFKITRNKYINNKIYENQVFNGNVFLLTSKSTYSAAMMLADCMQTYKIASIVGESPGNTANCFSNIVRYSLPYSRLLYTVSTTTFHRLNSSINMDRIKPDIECNSRQALDSTKVLINSRTSQK